MPTPLISIICPLYNKLNYVKETVVSVINQTYENWELIIVDDGSTDGSYELVEEWAAVNERLKLYKRKEYKENKGGSVCRNIGIALAKGEYVIFLDADDLLLNHCLENRLTLALTYPLNHFYVFNHALFYDISNKYFQKKVHDYLHKIGFSLSKNKELCMLRRFLKYDLPWTITNVLWKRETLRAIGGFDESFQRFQDPEIHTKALLLENIKMRCFKYNLKPDVLIRIDKNRHQGSMTDEVDKFRIYIEVINKYVLKYVNELKQTKKPELVNYLNGYFFSAEANYHYKKLAGEEFNQNKEIIKELALLREKVNIPRSFKYKILIILHDYASSNFIARKCKLPAFLYRLYMI